MRFGACVEVDQAAAVAEAGYDYVELNASAVLNPRADDTDWHATRRIVDAMPLRPEAFNIFITGAKVTGPEADAAFLEAYIHTLFSRAAQVGGKIIVFGSGKARGIPEDFSRDAAQKQILQFLNFCADAYETTGVVVAIEPLNTGECNILNTVAESAGYVRRIDRPGVRVLADTYHMEKNGESLDTLVLHADVLAHTHTDTGRFAPGTSDYDHAAFFRALKSAQYDARLSMECVWGSVEAEAGPALARLKSAHSAASQLRTYSCGIFRRT